MTVKSTSLVVFGVGVLTLVLEVVRADTAASLLAVVQLGVLVGLPLTLLVRRELRWGPLVAVIAVALSLSISSLAAQSLVWFGMTGLTPVVLTSSVYGLVAAWMLVGPDDQRGDRLAPTGARAQPGQVDR